MTIQRTVLLSLAAVLAPAATTPTANAQCHRHRPIAVRPIHHGHHDHGHHRPSRYVAHRPHLDHHYLQTAQLPPAPRTVAYGSFSHVDDLAARLEVLMNELCLDLYYNYSHNPGFHETYAEAYSLFQTTRYIHASEHNYDRDAIRQQLGGADALFHHIQDDVRGWSRIARRQIGTLGILTKMEMAEDTLHHLMEDVGVVVTPGLEEPPQPSALSALSVPPPPIRIP